MSQTAKLTPNLDKHGTKILNLTVLQRIDPFIEEILLTAAHVAFYEFNIDNTQWSRKDVEGSLFVVKRNAQPRFQFIVMNRRNTENLVENLLGDFEYEVQVPYLLYRNAAQEVNGVWFYNPRECEEVANLFSRILNAYSKVPPKVKESSSKSEFEELGVFSRRSIMEEPPEPPSTAPAATNVPENSSFENFFNAALNVGNGISNKANSRQPVVPLSSHTAVAVSAPMPSQQASSIPLSSFPSSVAVHDTREPIDSANRITNLVKPSTFFTAPSSSALLMPSVSSTMPTATTIHPPQNLQRPYGTPLLQPFPPPAPPPSFTPSSTSQFLISRDKIRDALLMLVQDDQFVDLFHQAVVKSQLS